MSRMQQRLKSLHGCAQLPWRIAVQRMQACWQKQGA